MLHEEDTVQEIATGRQGKITSIQSQGVAGKEPIPNQWLVVFSDGKQPGSKNFGKKDDLSLIECPHSQGEPGIHPAKPLAEPL